MAKQLSKEDIENMKKGAEKNLSELNSKKIDASKIKKQMTSLSKKAKKDFQKKLKSKFQKKLLGIVVTPPQPNPDKKVEPKPEIIVLCKSKKTDNIAELLKEKSELDTELQKITSSTLKNEEVNLLLLDELWDMCLKSKYEILSMIAMGEIVYDTGMLSALKLAEVHKMKVLQKFEKYVVSYVIGGSLIRGTDVEGSDIDTYVVIDDTDVTRLTSSELKTRLMSMIYQFAHEASQITGIKREFQIQVYVLTDMWNSIKNAHPVIFTFLRDGIPLYDRGMFAPWKLLLKKGKITPSPEAVDQYTKSGKQLLERTKAKLKEIAQEDFFWATCTPTQGALMMAGIPPGAPKEVAAQLEETFVKPGLLEKKYLSIWKQIVDLRKGIEYGKIKDVDASTIQEMFPLVEKYLERLDKLMDTLEDSKIKEAIDDLYEKSFEESCAALSMIGISKVCKKDIIPLFTKNLVNKKLAPTRYIDILKKIQDLKKSKNSTRQQIASLEFEQSQLIRDIYDMIRANKGTKIEKYKVNVEYNKGKGSASLWLLGDKAFIVSEEKGKSKIKEYKLTKSGELQYSKMSSLAEMDKVVSKFSEKPTIMTKKTIDSLKKILADDMKIVIG